MVLKTRSGKNLLRVKIICYLRLTLWLAILLPAGAALAEDSIFDLRQFPGQWTFVTNQDATVTATGSAVLRRGDEVYQRVLLLKAVPVETAVSRDKLRRRKSGNSSAITGRRRFPTPARRPPRKPARKNSTVWSSPRTS